MSNHLRLRRNLLTAGAVLLTLPTLSACSDKSSAKTLDLHGSDISGTGLGTDLSMPDATGTLRTLDSYKDKVVVVFFGFTQCPDVCPTAMAELAHTMELLGDDAKQVQVIMISVDPERDDPKMLLEYVGAFHPDFIGLSGTPEQLHTTAKSFKAFYAKAPGATPEQYTMDHSSSFYVFDKKGDVRILMGGNASAKEIADDLRQLL